MCKFIMPIVLVPNKYNEGYKALFEQSMRFWSCADECKHL